MQQSSMWDTYKQTGAGLCRDCLHPLMNVSSEDAFQMPSSALIELSAVHAHRQHSHITSSVDIGMRRPPIGHYAIPGACAQADHRKIYSGGCHQQHGASVTELSNAWDLFHAEGLDGSAPWKHVSKAACCAELAWTGPCACRQAAYVTVRSMPLMQAGNIYQNLPWLMSTAKRPS